MVLHLYPIQENKSLCKLDRMKILQEETCLCSCVCVHVCAKERERKFKILASLLLLKLYLESTFQQIKILHFGYLIKLPAAIPVLAWRPRSEPAIEE